MGDDDWGATVDEQERKLTQKVSDFHLTGGSGGQPSRSQPPTKTLSPPVSGRPAAADRPVLPQTHVASSNHQGQSITPVSSPGAEAQAQSPAESWDVEENTDPGANAANASLINKLLRSRLINSTSDIEVLRKDPNSPLHSVKSFDELPLKEELRRGVYAMNFNAPSKIQETALPALLASPPSNMIAQSQSGTGKTAAFVLTMLSRVDISKPWTQCVCLAPTYELALQIGDVTKQMAKYMNGVQIKYAIRGEHIERGKPLTEHIVIGTPGTTVDWCTKYRVLDLKKVIVFVLDEADVMIATQGHKDQSVRIRTGLRDDCQMLLFSATYDDEVIQFANKIVPNPFTIKLRREEESLDNIKQYYIECRDKEDKFQALSNIYGSISIGQSMIFCATKHAASWLAQAMTKEGHAVALLSGELQVEQRAAVIARFREGKEKVLITTNVTARGIDVEQVTVVINFDLPTDMNHQADCETYLHRIGRTGRFGKKGLAINMIDTTRSRQILQVIENHFGRKCMKLDAEDLDAIEKIGNN